MSDVTEDDNGDEEEDVDWEMSSPRKDEICQALTFYGYVVFFKMA